MRGLTGRLPRAHNRRIETTASKSGLFGDYEILDEIARGGMGVIYRARQISLNRFVALKMVRDSHLASARSIQRFQIEAEAAAKLDHPNIVPIYEFGALDNQRFLSMKLVEGTDLVKHLRGVPMEGRRLAQLMATLARAIHYAHQRGILHRDLKPANILLDGQGQPHVTDFGLARLADQDSGLTLSSDIIGSPNYMAPEQAAGKSHELTTAADVYSLGAIMYELLTGRPPFRAETPLETMRKVREEEPDPPRSLYTFADADLETICLKCMEKDPQRRYGSAESLAEDLERWLRQEPIRARPVTPVERVMKWMRRNPKVATLLVLLHLVFLIGLAGIVAISVRLASANREKDRLNIQLANHVRDFEWQKIDDLISTGKRSDGLANLSNFLRQDPNDRVAATRLVAMMSGCNFCLPAAAPMRHGAAVNTLSLSRDGRRLITAADDGKARLWDLKNGRVLTTLTHPMKVTQASFVADERFVLTTSQDGTSRLWDSNDATIVFEFPKAPDARMPLLLSRDRSRVALLDTDVSVQVWDVATRQQLGGSLRLSSNITWAAFSPDLLMIAIGSEDGAFGVWRVETSQPIIAPLKMAAIATKVEFSPDGNILATTWGGGITFWDARRWAKLKEFQAHDSQVLWIEFSPDGRRLVSAAFNRPLKIWDVASGQMLGQPIEAERPFAYFKLSPDGTRLATRSQNGVARVWDAFTGVARSEPFEHAGPVTDLNFSPSGQFILTASQDGMAQVWEAQAGQAKAFTVKTTDLYPSASFSPDGRLVIRTSERRAEAFDSQTGQRVGKPMVHSDEIYRMKFSPDGKKLATASWDGMGRVWDPQTGEPLTPPLQHQRRLYAIAFSPDSRVVATGSEDTTARLWDAVTGQPIGPPLVHQGEVMHVHFSPDSRTLLTASVDGTARLWSTDKGEPLWPEPLRHKGIVWTAEFSPDGRRIVTASADRSAMVWDAQSRRALTRPMLHERSVYGAHFSADGQWVLTCSEDGTARVWDAASGEPVSQPMRHKDKLAHGEFSPDGRLIFTGSQDGVARLWDARTGYPVSEPLKHTGEITCVQFSPDGRRCLSIASSDSLRLWDVMNAPTPVPAWFCEFVEAVAGKRLNAHGDAEPISRELIQRFRDQFADDREMDFYSRWAHWFLYERLKDPAPAFVN